MKNLKYVLVILLSSIFINCSTTQNKTLNDGSSIENAIKVGSVDQEYKIVREKCTDCKLKSQSLRFNNNKPFDVLTFIKPNGEEVNYYFDISKFYGKF